MTKENVFESIKDVVERSKKRGLSDSIVASRAIGMLLAYENAEIITTIEALEMHEKLYWAIMETTSDE